MPDNVVDKFEDRAKTFDLGLDLVSQYPHYGKTGFPLLPDYFNITIYKRILTQDSFTGFCESVDKVLGKMYFF